MAVRLKERALWSIVPNATLHLKIWDDECVVFNSGSGQTHVVDPIATLLIRRIKEGPIDSQALLSHVAKLLDVELTSEVRNALEARLQYLDELSLIEPSA